MAEYEIIDNFLPKDEFNNLNDAIEKRDALIKKYPPKSLTDYNIKEKTKNQRFIAENAGILKGKSCIENINKNLFIN